MFDLFSTKKTGKSPSTCKAKPPLTNERMRVREKDREGEREREREMGRRKCVWVFEREK